VQGKPSSGSGDNGAVKQEGDDDDADENEGRVVAEQGLVAKDTASTSTEDTEPGGQSKQMQNSLTRRGDGGGADGFNSKRGRRGSGKDVSGVKKKSKTDSHSRVTKRLQEYKELAKNFVVTEVSREYKKHKQDVGPCGCSQGDCTDSKTCKNREMQHECGMGKCMRGCRNVGGVKDPRILPETYVACSPISGEGLFANEDIEQGTEIGQYLGKVLTGEMLADAMEGRGADAMRYDIALQPSPLFLDASTHGNLMRFINHSCNPNCSFNKWTDADGFPIIKVFSIRRIKKGEELTNNHGWTDGSQCTCGEPNCVGTFGGATRNASKKSAGSEKFQFSLSQTQSEWK
jgi:hypothetical protein